MKKRVFTILLSVFVLCFLLNFLLNCGGGRDHRNGREYKAVALTHVNLITMENDKVLENRTVIIENGTITRITSSANHELPDDVLVINCNNKYLLPGLVDMHAHFWDVNELTLFIVNGITSVRGMGEFPDPARQPESYLNDFSLTSTIELRKMIERNELIGPTLYLAGHFLDGDPPENSKLGTRISNVDEVEGIIQADYEAGYDYIKVYSNLPEDIFDKIVEEAGKRSMKVVGHVPRSIAFEKGLETMRTVEHLMGFDTNSEERIKNARYYAQLSIDNDVCHCPTLTYLKGLAEHAEGNKEFYANREEWKYLSSPTKKLVEDINDATDQAFGFSRLAFSVFKDFIIGDVFRDMKVTLIVGADSPASLPGGFSIHDELNHLVEAGLRPYEAIRAATYNAALCLDRLAEFGTVSTGKRADLILVKENPIDDVKNLKDIQYVILRGKVYNKQQLDEMLNDLVE
jgi:imidazolonepropionase-like amidohydrolase